MRAEVIPAIDLQLPLAPAINQYAEDAHLHAIEWVKYFRLVEGEASYGLFRRSRLATLVARFYPIASLDELLIAADLVSWVFVLDDYCDERSLGRDPKELGRVLERYTSILEGEAPAPESGAMGRALYDVQRRIARRAGPLGMREVIVGAKAYFNGILWESENRARGITPDLATFIKMRPAAGAVPLFLSIVPLMSHIDFSPELSHSPAVMRLTTLAGNIICWINDLLSLPKEMSSGEVHNLVLVYQHEYDVSCAEAVELSLSMYHKDVNSFIEIESTLPWFGAADADLKGYLRTLRAIIRGTLDFSVESLRYRFAQPFSVEPESRSGAGTMAR